MNSEELYNAAPGLPQKIKKALTLAERIEVIREYEKNSNTRYLARQFGCGRTQIQNILRHRQEYLNEWENNGNPYRVRRQKSVQLLTLGAIVYEWVQRCRSQGYIITDDLIRETGKQVARILDMPDFRPTNRWLERLKAKYKLFDLSLERFKNVLSGENSGQKSLLLEHIIRDLRNPYVENNCLVLPRLKQLEGNFYHNRASQKTSNGYIETFKEETNQDKAEDDVYILSDNEQSDDIQGNEVTLLNVESAGNPEAYEGVNRQVAAGITTYKEAVNFLGPLEQFALMSEDIRAIGLINQLENIFRKKM